MQSLETKDFQLLSLEELGLGPWDEIFSVTIYDPVSQSSGRIWDIAAIWTSVDDPGLFFTGPGSDFLKRIILPVIPFQKWKHTYFKF